MTDPAYYPAIIAGAYVLGWYWRKALPLSGYVSAALVIVAGWLAVLTVEFWGLIR